MQYYLSMHSQWAHMHNHAPQILTCTQPDMLSTHTNRTRGLIQLPSLAEQGMYVQGGSTQQLNSDIQSSQQWPPSPSALSCCHWDALIPLFQAYSSCCSGYPTTAQLIHPQSPHTLWSQAL